MRTGVRVVGLLIERSEFRSVPPMTVLLRGFIFHPAIFLADERRCSTNRKRPTIVANAEYVVKVAFSFRLVRARARISVKEVIHEYETRCRPQRFYKTNGSDDRRACRFRNAFGGRSRYTRHRGQHSWAKPGYSPQVGTMVSMLTWMQDAVVRPVQGMTKQDLDYLFDAHANSIGALLLHLAATETYYQMNTFQGTKWDSWPDAVKQKWDPAMNLGDAGRKTIKGTERGYYLDALRETREKSLAEFRKRDDAWLMAVDQTWPWGPTNNYCKWFHVCEHESHHAGQIDMLKKRLPGAKPDA